MHGSCRSHVLVPDDRASHRRQPERCALASHSDSQAPGAHTWPTRGRGTPRCPQASSSSPCEGIHGADWFAHFCRSLDAPMTSCCRSSRTSGSSRLVPSALVRDRVPDGRMNARSRAHRHSTTIIPELSPELRKAAVDSYADALRVVFICQAAINFICFLCCLPIQENPLPCVPVFLALCLWQLMRLCT